MLGHTLLRKITSSSVSQAPKTLLSIYTSFRTVCHFSNRYSLPISKLIRNKQLKSNAYFTQSTFNSQINNLYRFSRHLTDTSISEVEVVNNESASMTKKKQKDKISELIVSKISSEMNIESQYITNTIQLLNNDNTIPFITRYRKEMTGSLHEEQIGTIEKRYDYFVHLEDRKSTILETIKNQGKLTAELEKKIKETEKLQLLEDIYLPFKPKKRTLAKAAIERGLLPIAEDLLYQKFNSDSEFENSIKNFINSEKELNNEDDVIKGIRHIIAEHFSEIAELRQDLRTQFINTSIMESSKLDKKNEKESTNNNNHPK